MQLYAMSTGSFSKGALILGVFALGTAPGLLGVGGLTAILKGPFSRYFFKFAGLVVVILALVNISNGYNLTGWRGISFAKNISGDIQNTVIKNDEQLIRMDQNTTGYSPDSFTVKQNIPVKWIITGKDQSSCSNSLIMTAFGIKKGLKLGENIITFTPKETGQFKFSCIMGMYRGTITVIENRGSESTTTSPQTTAPIFSSTSTLGYSPNPTETAKPNVQLLKITYTNKNDIVPSSAEVIANAPVRVEIEVKDEGGGCMGTILIPGLYDTPEFLEKGKTIVMEFTPEKMGSYQFTCAMGVPRGILIVK